jgi:hypothetical protein
MGVTELSSGLSSELGIRVLPTMIFSYPTLPDIVQHKLEVMGLSDMAEADLEDGDVSQSRSSHGRGCGLGHCGRRVPLPWRCG